MWFSKTRPSSTQNLNYIVNILKASKPLCCLCPTCCNAKKKNNTLILFIRIPVLCCIHPIVAHIILLELSLILSFPTWQSCRINWNIHVRHESQRDLWKLGQQPSFTWGALKITILQIKTPVADKKSLVGQGPGSAPKASHVNKQPLDNAAFSPCFGTPWTPAGLRGCLLAGQG